MSANNWPARCDGQTLRQMVLAAYRCLEANRDVVNGLNVFPVPDGDTGTNMTLTMRAAWRQVESTSAEPHAGNIAQAVSRGALMGARGNSGVILSQIWRGFARALENVPAFDAAELAVAYREAADTAYKGVMRPVEGTILTVVREGAEEAEAAAVEAVDWIQMLRRILERSKLALARTPEMLAVLKQAGVVDSGGQGLVYMLEGMVQLLDGELTVDQLTTPDATGAAPQMPAQALARPEDGQVENPYDVQFLLMGENLDVSAVRNAIDAMGDSTVVVGDESTIKVHIHVKDPGVPLSYGVGLGTITDVVVENMQEQMETIIEQGQVSNGYHPPTIEPPSLDEGQIGVVTVAPGTGLAEVYQSLGAHHVVSGGQTNNPSTAELYEAIEATPTKRVIVLPNNKNIILAAEAARDMSTKEVVIVPTRTVPQGMSALMQLDQNGDLEQIAAAMRNAVEDVISVEITTATRTVELDGVSVKSGQTIVIANGKLAAAGDQLDDVLQPCLSNVVTDEHELTTIYFGADAEESDALALADQITALFPHLETEIVRGGQAHYFFILGIE